MRHMNLATSHLTLCVRHFKWTIHCLTHLLHLLCVYSFQFWYYFTYKLCYWELYMFHAVGLVYSIVLWSCINYWDYVAMRTQL